MDDELKKVEQHFTFEMSFLVDRVAGVEEELTTLSEEEKVDLEMISDKISSAAVERAEGFKTTPENGIPLELDMNADGGRCRLITRIRDLKAEREQNRKDRDKEKELEARGKRVS